MLRLSHKTVGYPRPTLEISPLLSGRFPPWGGGGGAPQKHTTSQLRLDTKFFAGMPLWVFCILQNFGLWVTWVASH